MKQTVLETTLATETEFPWTWLGIIVKRATSRGVETFVIFVFISFVSCSLCGESFNGGGKGCSSNEDVLPS